MNSKSSLNLIKKSQTISFNVMKKAHLFIFFVLAATLGHAQTSTSDCEGAIVLCGGIYSEKSAPPGTGNVYEFTGGCNQGLETMSLWYTFTVQEAGNISFIIDPNNDADDYDWGMFNITNGGCAGIVAQDGSSPEVECNSYGSFSGNGPTGISSANGGTGNSNGPGDLNGPAFNADLPVQPGETYAIVVMNWSNSLEGYTIDFTQSTATIYDESVPEIVSVEPLCGNKDFRVIFSEDIVTSTVQPEDFTIANQAGNTNSFATVSPSNPGAFAQTSFVVSLADSLTEGGTYIVSITNVQGNVEDICGNVAIIDTTFEVNIVPPVEYALTINNACNGENGSIEASYISGGTAPIAFEIDGVALDDVSGFGLDSGQYVITVRDSQGCEISETRTVPNHEIELSISPLQDSLSCANPLVQITGVLVTPPQTVSYLWGSITANGVDSLFSLDSLPQTDTPGTYFLTVLETQSGCSDTASTVVSESELAGLDLNLLQFPNVISANNDGKNDSWRPFLLTDPDFDITLIFDEYTLLVFNRWGQKVFDSSEENERLWTPENIPAGSYFYTVSYKSDCGTVVDKQQKGMITVLN